MTQKIQERPFEPRGVLPPAYLVEYVRSELERIGEVQLARRLGFSRNPVLRVAAGKARVHIGTIAVLEADYRANGLNPRAA